ncbi:hypothetical protein SAMN05880582_101663 [Rhizobium sp. RU20A]|nr:hypothetical protein SAMN05880582_101663 [Rhizobium sp. RU20A]
MSNNFNDEDHSSSLDGATIEAVYSEEYGNIIEKVKYRLPNGDKTFRTYFLNPLKFDERQSSKLTQERFIRDVWLQNDDILGELPKVPLFRQAEIEAAKADADFIPVYEGEEDARIGGLIGLPGTTNFDGGGQWAARYTEALKGANGLAIFQDEDEKGVEAAVKIAEEMFGKVGWVKIIRLPGLRHKGDLRDWYNDHKALGWKDEEIRAEIISIIKKTKRWSPVVVADGQLVSMIDRAEHELVERLAGVYQRGNQLVKAVKSETPTFKGGKTKSYKLLPMSADSLRETMGRCMVFQKVKHVKLPEKAADGSTTVKTYVSTNPPRDVAQTLLSSGRASKLPEVAGVISCPTLRPDGSVLDREGYDLATGLLVLEPLSLPSDMAMKPTKQDAEAAIAKLDKLLDGFPFKSDADRSSALSLLMTPVLRPCMEAAPLHAISANGAGVGKSYLADIAATIATGERAPVTSSGWSVEEMEKRLTGPLLDGSPFITLDNLDKFPIAGDFFCQAVERPRLSLRALGTTGNREILNRSFMCATGIGVTINGDMLRRTLLISLDVNEERPELRKFDFDPLAEVMKDRASYVSAVLTIVRAYILAGRPAKSDPLGSFGAWSDNVRSALVWLGKADPIKTMEEARKGDDSLNLFAEFMSAWWACASATKETAKHRSVDLLKEFKNDWNVDRAKLPEEARKLFDLKERAQEALHAFGSNARDQLTAIGLGKALKKHNGAVVNKMKLMSEFDSQRNVWVWYIKNIEQATEDDGLKIAA